MRGSGSPLPAQVKSCFHEARTKTFVLGVTAKQMVMLTPSTCSGSLLLTLSVLAIQGKPRKTCKSSYSSTWPLLEQRAAIMSPSSSSTCRQSFSCTLLLSSCLFPLLSFLSFRQGCRKNSFASLLWVLQSKLPFSDFHHKQGRWTGKVLLFPLPFSPSAQWEAEASELLVEEIRDWDQSSDCRWCRMRATGHLLFKVRMGFDQRNHHIILRESGSLANIL